MKKQIRRGVFETNSSSTHSVSICDRNKIEYSDIPKNSKIIIDDNYSTGTDIFDELGKLNFVVTMLASIVEVRCDEDEMEIKSFEEMTNLNWFKWLAEVVKEESNTEVIYECPRWSYSGEFKEYVPYYETTWDEYETIEEIFTGDEYGIMEDEVKFKERVRDIIYNPSIIIEDKENEY